MAKDGSAPQCCSATVSSEVVVVLPWVPATATTTAALHHRLERRRARQQPQPAPLAPRPPRGWSSRTAVETTTVSASPRLAGVVARRSTRAPRARSASSVRDSLASLPVTVMPRASMIRAMPESPAPPMPTKCTRPSSVGGQQVVGDGDPHRRRPGVRGASTRSASFSSASSGIRSRGGGRHRGQPVGVGEQGGHGAAHPLRGQGGVGDQQPAAGVDDRPGVEGLLAVADRQRHEDRRQADAGHLGDGVAAGAADHGVGGGVGEVHPVDVRHHDVRRAAGRRLRARPRPCGPTTCSTCTPAAAKAGAAAATDWFSRRAPCEPPVTSSVGRSGSSPKNVAPPRRAAPPGRGC